MLKSVPLGHSRPRCTHGIPTLPLTCHTSCSRKLVQVARRRVIQRASSPESESAAILDAFFLGRAFAETLNERLGAFLGDLLSEYGKWDAERQRAFKDFQDDIQARADSDKLRYTDSSGSQSASGSPAALLPESSSASPGPPSNPAAAPPSNFRSFAASPSGQSAAARPGPSAAVSRPELEETVDELRAEVASARAAVQSYKAKKRQSGFR